MNAQCVGKRRKQLQHACEKVMETSARLRGKTKKFEEGKKVRALLNNSHIAQTRRKCENEAGAAVPYLS